MTRALISRRNYGRVERWVIFRQVPEARGWIRCPQTFRTEEQAREYAEARTWAARVLPPGYTDDLRHLRRALAVLVVGLGLGAAAPRGLAADTTPEQQPAPYAAAQAATEALGWTWDGAPGWWCDGLQIWDEQGNAAAFDWVRIDDPQPASATLEAAPILGAVGALHVAGWYVTDAQGRGVLVPLRAFTIDTPAGLAIYCGGSDDERIALQVCLSDARQALDDDRAEAWDDFRACSATAAGAAGGIFGGCLTLGGGVVVLVPCGLIGGGAGLIGGAACGAALQSDLERAARTYRRAVWRCRMLHCPAYAQDQIDDTERGTP